jgi:hypothetical protein
MFTDKVMLVTVVYHHTFYACIKLSHVPYKYVQLLCINLKNEFLLQFFKVYKVKIQSAIKNKTEIYKYGYKILTLSPQE